MRVRQWIVFTALSALTLMALAACGGGVVPAPAEKPAAGTKDLAPGFSVDAALLEAAKKEGKVVWWGAFPEQHVRTIASKFEEISELRTVTLSLEEVERRTMPTNERFSDLFGG